ncbi:MAG: hypothetical protein AYK19_21525 [Theionarchaea archaeon DG-70-1]|nr:MAG: hypothetical protein AYK19_21525 [Theionarchaea archaeon DG-70-1]
MHYFEEVPTDPKFYLLEGDPPLLKEFTSYVLVKRTPSLMLDGGNSFNPFVISFFCRKLQVDAMEQIYVSRAFTVFQLRMLITKELPLFIKRENPCVVVVSFYSNLFHSDDVEEDVLTILYQKLLIRLKETVRRYHIPVMVTDYKNSSSCSSLFDCSISFKIKRNTFLLSIDENTLSFPLVPSSQKTLDYWRGCHG